MSKYGPMGKLRGFILFIAACLSLVLSHFLASYLPDVLLLAIVSLVMLGTIIAAVLCVDKRQECEKKTLKWASMWPHLLLSMLFVIYTEDLRYIFGFMAVGFVVYWLSVVYARIWSVIDDIVVFRLDSWQLQRMFMWQLPVSVSLFFGSLFTYSGLAYEYLDGVVVFLIERSLYFLWHTLLLLNIALFIKDFFQGDLKPFLPYALRILLLLCLPLYSLFLCSVPSYHALEISVLTMSAVNGVLITLFFGKNILT